MRRESGNWGEREWGKREWGERRERERGARGESVGREERERGISREKITFEWLLGFLCIFSLLIVDLYIVISVKRDEENSTNCNVFKKPYDVLLVTFQ